ncbi:hypothetical protein HKX48_002155 [Thoreauomyces humboldtii]|nr:hypothetical protein HKX48_002155 [Thoreauomyces humboldtii]
MSLLSGIIWHIARKAPRKLFTDQTIKASVTYLVAITASLSTWADSQLEGSSYLVAMAVLYFHPARTVGAMVEAMICCLVGLALGYFIAVGCTHVAVYYQNDQRNEIEAHAIAMVVLFLVTFLVAFIRAKWGRHRPSIATACTLTHFLTFVTITQISSEGSLAQLPQRIDRITIALLCGSAISFLGCCIIQPKTASSVLRQDISKGFNTLRSFFDTLANTFSLISDADNLNSAGSSLGGEDQPGLSKDSCIDIESTHEKLEALFGSHQQMLLRLSKSRHEVLFEPTTSLFMHRRRYSAIFRSAERLSQHLAGLQSSIIEVDKIITEQPDHVAVAEYILNMGPSMRQLVMVCKQCLALLENLFAGPNPNYREAEILLPALQNLFESLVDALEDFDQNQKRVLLEIYKHVHVFFFTFELMEFAKELIRLISALEKLKKEVIERREMGKLCWAWKQFRTKHKTDDKPARPHLLERRNGDRRSHHPNTASVWSAQPKLPPQRRFSRTMSITGALEIQDEVPVKEPWSVRIWAALSSLKDFEARFALKTAITVSLLSLPAFLDVTQDMFHDYRMHWALSTFVVVMTPSVGGTNAAGLWRLLGTWFGAGMAVIAGVLFPGSSSGLLFMSALVCVPSMHIFLHSSYPLLGQISLITFTIIIFNDFSGATDPISGEPYDIFEIAIRRGFSVAVGVIIGMFVSWYIWPFTARKALRVGLSDVIFEIGLLYSRLVGLFDSGSEPTREDLHEFLEDELALRLSLASLRGLLHDTAHEPRLRGPFPKQSYASMIGGCSQILNKLISMRAGMTINGFAQVRADFVQPVRPARQRMIGTILLYLYLISGALILRFPLPPLLPDARAARDALVTAIRALPAVQPASVGAQKDPAYIYYYAYVMAMDHVVSELEALGSVCMDLFGVMSLGGMDDAWRDRWGNDE